MNVAVRYRVSHRHHDDAYGRGSGVHGVVIELVETADGSAAKQESFLATLTRSSFAFYFIVLSVMTPVWVVLRGAMELSLGVTAAIVLPVVALLSVVTAIRRS
jgi:hypothetical protein